MTDKEMIEEMAKVLHDKIVDKTWRAEKVAAELYKIAVPDGSVVISADYELPFYNKDECEYWKSRCKEIGDVAYKQARKETAREFAGKIQDYLNDKVCEEFGDNACDVTYFTIDVDKVISDVFEIAEQFGVEVE